MTEADWLACTDPIPMLAFLRGKASDRKVRLLMAAACRRILHLLEEPQYLALVGACERVADGTLSPASLARYRTSCPPVSLSDLFAEERRWEEDSRDFNSPVLAKRAVWLSGSRDRHRVEECLPYASRGLRAGHSIQEELANQCRLILDIFGNPFRPASLNAAWLAWNHGTVSKLAQSVYEERTFDRLPILADALEEAGCTNPDILQHCRQPGEHVRGCWLVDLLLKKE
jgi:hypothetical protein